MNIRLLSEYGTLRRRLRHSLSRQNRTDLGAGIYNQGALNLSRSTVSGNEALSASGGIHSNGSGTLTNVTVHGNSTG